MGPILKVKQFKDSTEFEQWQAEVQNESTFEHIITQIQIIPVSLGGSATQDGKFGGELTFCISIVYYIK